VHDYNRRPAIGKDPGHGRIMREAAHIIDHVRPGINHLPGDIDFPRVYGQRDLCIFKQTLHHRPDPLNLIGRTYRVRARPGRLATDIDYVGAVCDHLPGMPKRFRDSCMGTAVIEGIRSDIEDTHNERALIEVQDKAT
jgi:SAM-dependent methyltransferase